ncbi:MAG: sensor histidine kinase [Leptolyngbya sp. PLA1]|nr:sensor histidine kinase [Leptolyngbya sp. PLA1]
MPLPSEGWRLTMLCWVSRVILGSLTEPDLADAPSTSRPHSRETPEPPPAFFDRRPLRALLRAPLGRGLLTRMRIRKKLVVLHTLFSLVLAAILLVALRPALAEIVKRAEASQAVAMLDVLGPELGKAGPLPALPGAILRMGDERELGLGPQQWADASARPGTAVPAASESGGDGAIMWVPGRGMAMLSVRLPAVRAAVTRLYLFVVVALLAAYAAVVIALEVLVLPQNVYEPIRRMYAADLAVAGGVGEEIIPEHAIPSDELGDIMRSRNQTVERLRAHEAALADALAQLEAVATDLRRKNHLLEATQRNLADADRLAGLGMMSAGIAHELNTPLAVLKGLVERLGAQPGTSPSPAEAALMLRVVGRLERLSEGLLDYARVRPPSSRPAQIWGVVQEAATLVSLDREASRVAVTNAVDEAIFVECDAGRMVQVFVNLIRNAVDAFGPPPAPAGAAIMVEARTVPREGTDWVSITVRDNGPGISAAVLPRLFEPFATTRLDSRGTGLGLAVAEGIVREHSGLLLGGNRTDGPGAVFEVLLPKAGLHARADAVESVQPGAHPA